MGIAREAAATFKQEFVPPQEDAPGNDEDVNDYIKIEVTDPDLCSRYCARVCKNIKIDPSPAWMQRRLAASGIRPINNLVDITNYVMEEYGHPMHAYDLSQVADSKIIVRRAKDGDTFVTLDGQSRKLDCEMLMICDGQKEIGIAGIMGGENSKITDDVTTVLLEAAVFNGANIRKSAKRLGLRTEASGKFEKGLDPRNAEAAVNRACKLIEELGCGEVVGGIADAKEEIKPLRRIAFIPDKINHALGTDISKQDMLDIFSREGLSYEEESEVLVIPSFRQDLEGFVDIVEEVARFYGYDKIPSTLPKGEATSGKLPYKLRIEQELREGALSCGFSQGMSYSFESPKVFDKLLLTADDERRKVVTITNPMGEDFSIMRSIPLNGMLTSLSFNYNRRNKNVKLFEMGNIYLAEELPLKELPQERMQLTLGFYGDGDFYTMKGVVEAILERVGMTAAGKNRSRLTFSAQGDYPFLHPGRKAQILWDGQVLGYLGEVHPKVQENYEIGARTYVAVLDIPAILPATTFDRKYESLARFPAVTRDISMVVPSSVTAGEIEQVISGRGGKLLEDYALFDLYEGEQIQAGYKSMAYSITLRAKDRTLEESDAAGVMKKLLKGLEQLGAQLRQV
jgi:phenylalanyl-tRNA synthetase beta chain